MGRDASSSSDEDIQKLVAERARRFREDAPTTAAEAATIILDGVKADRWRILVGPDAQIIDEMVRAVAGTRLRRRLFRELREEGRLAPPDLNGRRTTNPDSTTDPCLAPKDPLISNAEDTDPLAGLDPAIHVLARARKLRRRCRLKAGHGKFAAPVI